MARALAAPVGCRWACGGDVFPGPVIFFGRVAMEKMADSLPISVLKLLVSQNFYNKLQHVIKTLTFSLQLFYYVCYLHDIFSEVLLGLGLIGFKNRSSMRMPIM